MGKILFIYMCNIQQVFKGEKDIYDMILLQFVLKFVVTIKNDNFTIIVG